MRLFDRFRRPRVNGSTPTSPAVPAEPPSEEELKQKAAQASFVVVEFAGIGQTAFRIQEQNVNPWQYAALAKTLDVRAERRIWDWENEIIERAKRSKIAVPGRTH